MPIGRVKWYDKGKGYGFIENPEGDVFFHFSDIKMDGFKALAEDQRVSYRLLRSDDGLRGKQIKPLDNRASVKTAARYRTMILMVVKEDMEEQYDQFVTNIPGWYDAFEQDLGLRRIGSWRRGPIAVSLVESEKPYEQALASAAKHPHHKKFVLRLDDLAEMLASEPSFMPPVMAMDTAEAAAAE